MHGRSCEAGVQLSGGCNHLAHRWEVQGSDTWHLKGNTLRYSELHRRIPKATDKMLAQQLRELERDGLIKRVVYPVVPPKTEYSLTPEGETLYPVLDAMCDWGTKHMDQ